MVITTRDDLSRLARELRGAPRLALDTEFIRERRYYPQLEILQLATPETEAIVDYQAIGTLEPLEEILFAPGTLKIFHAGKQDLEIFFNLTGSVPAPLYDTQVAAALLGFGAQVGYSRLVAGILDVTLDKSETLTDWARRPLTEAQLHYALNDVRYLLQIHSELESRLQALGRADWLEDEWQALERAEAYMRTAPRAAYRRISGWHRLKPRQLAILRELAAWREEEAIQRDQPPSRILKDHLLIEVARRKPGAISALNEIRGFPSRLAGRWGRSLIAAVKRVDQLPREEWPVAERNTRLSEEQQALVTLLQAYLRARAEELNIATNYLATASELRELVSLPAAERGGAGVMQGWRRRLVGDALDSLLDGQVGVAWDPEHGRLRLQDPG